MEKLADKRQEVLITRGAEEGEARAIQRRAKTGELTRVAAGIYLFESDPEAQKAILRRTWKQILAAMVPSAVVSHRSAYYGGLLPDGRIYLSHPTNFNRKITLPGVQAILLKGSGPLPGDAPFGNEKLFFASRPRQLLENLSPERGAEGKSAGTKAVEARLISILNASGEEELNNIRDTARELATTMALQKEFKKLDHLIGALLVTHSASVLKTTEGKLVAKGTPVDSVRMARFEILAARLRVEPLPRQAATAVSDPARSNFAFLESFFSNFVEGTEFAIEEARDIALHGRTFAQRPKDCHDIVGVFTLAVQSPWRDTVPPLGTDFPSELAKRHALMMEKRPESGPGHFKIEPNRAGQTWFVEPQLVRGTLIEGSNLAKSVPEGLARAIYYAFLISEIHPFSDGNGRVSRIVMNAELSRISEARIIIPTLFHEEYVDCQRQLTRHDDPANFIKALVLMQRWTAALDYRNDDTLIEVIKKTNALEQSRAQFKLTMPDQSPLA
jgi:Fic/DOC family